MYLIYEYQHVLPKDYILQPRQSRLSVEVNLVWIEVLFIQLAITEICNVVVSTLMSVQYLIAKEF